MAGVFLQVKNSNTCFLYGYILLMIMYFFQKHRDVCIYICIFRYTHNFSLCT